MTQVKGLIKSLGVPIELATTSQSHPSTITISGERVAAVVSPSVPTDAPPSPQSSHASKLSLLDDKVEEEEEEEEELFESMVKEAILAEVSEEGGGEEDSLVLPRKKNDDGVLMRENSPLLPQGTTVLGLVEEDWVHESSSSKSGGRYGGEGVSLIQMEAKSEGNKNNLGVESIRVAGRAAICRLAVEERKLREDAARGAREDAGVSGDMMLEVQYLLEAFGVPYIIAPMEAEAQCAYLEMCGAVDGVVTDDSDTFLFGARHVYKNLFDDKQWVEMYSMDAIEKELSMSRDDLVSSALLLGSDYTSGVKGVGIVNAMEILSAFPGPKGLEHFRHWMHGTSANPTKKSGDAGGVAGSASHRNGVALATASNLDEGVEEEEEVEKEEVEVEKKSDSLQLESFKKKHAAARVRWEVASTFPSRDVMKAYTHPHVLEVKGGRGAIRFRALDVEKLVALCRAKLGWTESKARGELGPVVKAVSAGTIVQTTLGPWVAKFEDKNVAGKIKSKRLLKAVARRLGAVSSGEDGGEMSGADPRLKDMIYVEDESDDLVRVGAGEDKGSTSAIVRQSGNNGGSSAGGEKRRPPPPKNEDPKKKVVSRRTEEEEGESGMEKDGGEQGLRGDLEQGGIQDSSDDDALFIRKSMKGKRRRR